MHDETAGGAHPVGLRERKKAETRAALVRAAQELVVEQGLDATTVEAICSRAGVSRRTFFNYFDTKDEAVLGMSGDEELVPVAVREVFVTGGPTGNFSDDLVELVRGMLGAKRITRADAHRRHAVLHREPGLIGQQLLTFGRLKEAMGSALRERAAATDLPLDPALATVAAVTLVHASFTLWHGTDGDDDVVHHLDAAREQLATAFSSPIPR